MQPMKIKKNIIQILCIPILDKKLRKNIRNTLINFSLKEYLYFKKLDYKIISLGGFCLPRVITTAAGLKPKKIYGEKSCPFDICFHFNLKRIIECLNNNFINYFDNISYDKNAKCWVNTYISALYNHEGTFSKKEIITTYKKRIKNLINILKTNKKVYFIYSHIWNDRNYPTKEDIYELYTTLKLKRGNKPFELILILSEEIKNINENNIHQIVLNDFNINNPFWVEDFFNAENGKNVKKETNKNAYFFIRDKLKEIIK